MIFEMLQRISKVLDRVGLAIMLFGFGMAVISLMFSVHPENHQ
jgi:hypothetical protein